MKLEPKDDDDAGRADLIHRLESENGLVEMGVYRVMYGWRVRAGFSGYPCCELDWCAGSQWKNVEQLYSLCYAILTLREESRNCFEGLPTCSRTKPFYMDREFIVTVSALAGSDCNLIKLKDPEEI